MQHRTDIIVIGAGIAGTSAAAELADHANVILVEMEDQAGYHATGRSVSFFAAAYGNKVVRGITAASEHFFRAPPEGFSDSKLLEPRDTLYFGREDQRAKLAAMQVGNPPLQELSADEARNMVPIFSPGYLAGALRDTHAGNLDVNEILQGYLRMLRKRGGKLALSQAVKSMNYVDGLWQLTCGETIYSAPIVINAAGAWADEIASLAGLGRIGLKPLRRTAILIDAPEGYDITDWPQAVDVDDEFYFQPDAGQLLISPANEDLSPPCDVQPEELDLAIGLDRFEKATGLQVRRIKHSWAGLRTFTPDRTFVAGFDPRVTGFFWLAGQGGYGVQSAPGMAQLSSALVTGVEPSGPFSRVLDFASDVAPERFINNC